MESDRAEGDLEGPFPVLSSWAEGLPDDHYGQLTLARPDLAPAMEEILATLTEAAPLRLEGKRRAFRTDALGFLNLRAELNVGYLLARAGVDFQFGGDGQPDYRCSLAGGEGWIEVTTRSRDDLIRLHDELEVALREHDVLVILSTPRLLAIPKVTRSVICGRVAEAAGQMDPGGQVVPLPEIEGHAGLTMPGGFGNGQVTLQIGAALTDHLTAVEKVILTAVTEKVEQSERGGWSADTLLVIDPSRLGTSWLRPDEVWAQRLAAIPIPWDSTPFLGVAVVFSSLDRPGLHGAWVGRHGLSPAAAGKLAHFVAALGL